MNDIIPGRALAYIKILVFLALTLFFGSVFWLFSPAGAFSDGDSNYIAGFMWSPGFAAMVTYWIFGDKRLSVMLRQTDKKYFFMAVAIPFIYCLLAYLVAWVFGLGDFPNERTIAYIKERYGWLHMNDQLVMILYALYAGTFGILRACMLTIGEEIGWRGLLVSELYRVSNFYVTALVSGIIWALWHYPAIIYSGYNTGLPTWISLVDFTVMVIGMSFLLTWLRLRSGSLLPVALFHAAHNYIIQGILSPFTGNKEHTNLYIDEFGILIPLSIILVVICFRKEFQRLDKHGVYGDNHG